MLPELSTGPIRVSPLAASACACSALTDKRCRRADNFSDVWRDPPPGADRTYVRVQGPLSVASWLAGIKAGHTFGSTGPILLLTVNGHQQGDEIKLAADANATLPVHVEAFSIAPLDRLDIIVNGAVAHSVRITDPAHVIVDQPIAVPEGGWIAARVVGPSSRYVTDSYAFAQTSPVYVVRGGRVSIDRRRMRNSSPMLSRRSAPASRNAAAGARQPNTTASPPPWPKPAPCTCASPSKPPTPRPSQQTSSNA